MTTTKIMLGVGGIAALLLAFALFTGKVDAPEAPKVGSVNSPDLQIGGVRLFSQQTTALTQATGTVICSLQSPSSTSTLMSGGIQLTSATATPSSLSISKSATNATVGATVFASTTVAGGAFISLTTASSSAAGTHAFYTFSPNTYLNVAQQAAGLNGFNPEGSCSALWHVL